MVFLSYLVVEMGERSDGGLLFRFGVDRFVVF